MNSVVQKFGSSKQTVIDLCTCTKVTAKICIFLSSHCCFARCYIDSVCFKKAVLRGLNVFTRQIHIQTIDIVPDADLQGLIKILESAVDSIGARWKRIF